MPRQRYHHPMPIDPKDLDLLEAAVRRLRDGFVRLPAAAWSYDGERARDALLAAAERMHDNFPYHHPLYVGQMLKPPHPVAKLAYAMAMELNPNNHALDGGRQSSQIRLQHIIAGACAKGANRGLLADGSRYENERRGRHQLLRQRQRG